MHYKFFRLFFVLTLVVGLVIAATPQSVRAVGAIWYVSTIGSDANACTSPADSCATINAALGKASPGDTIQAAIGTYSGTGGEVVLLDKDTTLSGGWDDTFTTQNGTSTIEGEGTRLGMMVNSGVTVAVERFTVQNSLSGINNSGTLTLNNSTVSGNTSDWGSPGGGILNIGTIILNDSAIIGNNAGYGANGGGIFNNGTMTLNNSTVSGNTGTTTYWTGLGGGGIYNGSTLTLNNSTVSSNMSRGYGGGIFNNGTTTLSNSTVSGNTGNMDYYNGYGGGIFNYAGALTLKNTLVAGNSATSSGPDCSGSISSAGYNLIGNTSDCTFAVTTGDLTDIDPFLGQLQDNGGSTFTHALLPGSPAIDTGNPAGCNDQDGNPLTTDQRGVTRPQGIACDIGAYEFAFTTPGPATNLSIVSGSGQSATLNFAFSKPLRVVALDDQGNRISGVTVTFTAPANGASGIFTYTGTNTTTIDTDIGGVATTSIFTANDQAGAYTVSASAPGLESVNFSLEQAFHPANDNFANAEAISPPFHVAVDITDATNEPGEPQPCYYSPKTVWYSFTPTANAVMKADMAGSSFDDTILNIYQDGGSGIGALSLLQCVYYSNSATFSVQAGMTYYIQAGSIYSGGGDLHMNLQEIPRPANDDFAHATPISLLPSTIDFDNTGASFENEEPAPSCGVNSPPYRTIWFSFTALQSRYVSVSIPSSDLYSFFAVYSGTSLNNLTELGCKQYSDMLTFYADADQTYYFQVAGFFGQGGPGTFLLEPPPPPVVNFFYYAGDPSKFDTIQLQDFSYDPPNIGIQTYEWNFGDGAVASGYYTSHKYAADGDYQVTHTVTTTDGRTASITQTVQVRTHDVAITRIAVPNSANAGQTKTITVTLRNVAYPETVQIDLYKSTPNGFVWVATVTRSVPALSGNRTTAVSFSYTFTSDDARLGKVTFKAVATLVGARDVYPSDNEAISLITKVAR